MVVESVGSSLASVHFLCTCNWYVWICMFQVILFYLQSLLSNLGWSPHFGIDHPAKWHTMYARQFHSVPAATAIFQTHQYLLLSSLHFLTLLDYKEPSRQQGSILELSSVDLNRFRTLQNSNKQLQAAFKLSKTSSESRQKLGWFGWRWRLGGC